MYADDPRPSPATLVFISQDGGCCCDGLGLGDLFPDSGQVRRLSLTCSAQKPELIEEVLAGIGAAQSEAHAMLGQKAALMLDEMLENALYAAPRDGVGQPLFAKGSSRSLLPSEQIVLRYRFDGTQLLLEVRDSWGTLRPAQLFGYLALNMAEHEPDAERAGRGLFFMWRLMDQLYVSIDPGQATVVGGCLKLPEQTSGQNQPS